MADWSMLTISLCSLYRFQTDVSAIPFDFDSQFTVSRGFGELEADACSDCPSLIAYSFHGGVDGFASLHRANPMQQTSSMRVSA
jgi:hypothetical protein